MLSTTTSVKDIQEYCSQNISIIIPAYNEEKRIGPVLDEISGFISSNDLPWEVIVAVDGNDGTNRIVETYHNQFSFISSRTSVSRNGMGGAIKRGIIASRGEYIILMDADGSTKLNDIISKVELLSNYDIINFNRYSSADNNIPFTRRFASRGFNLILRALFLNILN